MSILGFVGILIFFAGLHVLWQARKEILYWLREFLRILRGEVVRRAGLAPDATGASSQRTSAAPEPRKRHNGTLRLLGGFGLVVLGQVLLLLDLVVF